tara:strand:- start:1163 stop:1390 length:228 start_codon:yes stop_codon:yes gene_type:complete
LLKKIKSFMGFKSNKVELKGVSTSKVDTPLTTKVELDEKELQFLLVTIKNSLFKGEYVELLYNLTLKLQNKYKEF